MFTSSINCFFNPSSQNRKMQAPSLSIFLFLCVYSKTLGLFFLALILKLSRIFYNLSINQYLSPLLHFSTLEGWYVFVLCISSFQCGGVSLLPLSSSDSEPDLMPGGVWYLCNQGRKKKEEYPHQFKRLLYNRNNRGHKWHVLPHILKVNINGLLGG